MSPAVAAATAVAAVPISPKAPATDAPAAADAAPKYVPRPDAAKYREQMAALNATIAEHRARLDAVHKQLPDYRGDGKAGDAPAPVDPVAVKRKEVRTRLDDATAKRNQLQETRNTTFTQIKQIQEGMKKKGDDLKSARDKLGYHSAEDCDKQIAFLEKQLNAGGITLGEEKRIVQQISQVKKVKKELGKLSGQQQTVEGDKGKLEELRKKLLDLDGQRDAARASIDALRAELTTLDSGRKEKQESLHSLHTQRKAIKAQLDAAFNELREVRTKFKEGNEAWDAWKKADFERKQKDQAAKALEERDERMRKVAERELENAEIPAYLEEIALCNSLIHHLQTYVVGAPVTPAPSTPATIAKPATLAVRQVTGNAPEGVPLRKKEPEVFLFMGKAKGGKKSGGAATPATPAKAPALKLDFKMIEELSKLSISLPVTVADAPATITALEAKVSHFQASQAAKTAANKAAAQAKIEELKAKVAAGEVVPELAEVVDEEEEKQESVKPKAK